MVDTVYIINELDEYSEGKWELIPKQVYNNWDEVQARLPTYFVYTNKKSPVYAIHATNDPSVIEQARDAIGDSQRIQKILAELSRTAQEDGDYE